MENARLEWETQQRQETSKQCEDAVKRQQEIWANERRENLSALERLKHELATVKKEYGITIEKLKRELAEERKKTQHGFKRQDSRSDASEVICSKIGLFTIDDRNEFCLLCIACVQMQE